MPTSNEYLQSMVGFRSLVDKLTLNPLGFSTLWFEPRSGHMWESQVLLKAGQVGFPGFSSFFPPFMNDRLDISEIFLKGP